MELFILEKFHTLYFLGLFKASLLWVLKTFLLNMMIELGGKKNQ